MLMIVVGVEVESRAIATVSWPVGEIDKTICPKPAPLVGAVVELDQSAVDNAPVPPR